MGDTRSKVSHKKMKIVKHFRKLTHKTMMGRERYLRYRTDKIKHSLWLKTRKSNTNFITEYDNYILKKLQPGKTAIFNSTGYSLEHCIEDLTVIEEQPIVKKFYPKAIIVNDRNDIAHMFPNYFDNFVITNNRSDSWVKADILCSYMAEYRKSMKNDCLFFYSMRDTMFTVPPFNRLKVNHYDLFVDLAQKIEKVGFKCCESTIDFANGDGNENPDTTNGNIKYLFKCIK
jgi:hypothetical protein